MFGSLGTPELMVILVIGLFYGVPIMVAVWAVITLRKIRSGQEAIGVRLEMIERLLQGGR
jgi:hypothetical protein